ncbi:hypothetical protein ACLIYM_02005 [Streptomyces fenghuangensis]
MEGAEVLGAGEEGVEGAEVSGAGEEGAEVLGAGEEGAEVLGAGEALGGAVGVRVFSASGREVDLETGDRSSECRLRQERSRSLEERFCQERSRSSYERFCHEWERSSAVVGRSMHARAAVGTPRTVTAMAATDIFR